jgi:hypothetical protein
VISFLDPAPYVEPTGLQAGACDDCGNPAAVDAAYAGAVRCTACWAALYSIDTMRPIAIPKHLQSRWTGAQHTQQPGRADDTAGLATTTSAPTPSQYRVLIAARDATPSQIPTGAAAVRAAAQQAGRTVRVTYALAEERATGRMVHSCAVRVRGLGYAVWRDGLFSDAWPKVGAAQFLALVAGAEYVPPAPRTPPPTGPCPRCGRSVRWKIKPTTEPYAHNRDLGGEGGRGQKVACVTTG